MNFKNANIKQLVKSVISHGNLVINDITDVKKEKERTDGKCQRMYYVAYPQSLDNITAARGVTMWQSHNSDGTSAIWKTAPNPARVRRVVDAGDDFHLPGFVVNIELTQSYDVNGNSTNKTTLYVPSMEQLEQELERFLVDVELLEEEPVSADEN